MNQDSQKSVLHFICDCLAYDDLLPNGVGGTAFWFRSALCVVSAHSPGGDQFKCSGSGFGGDSEESNDVCGGSGNGVSSSSSQRQQRRQQLMQQQLWRRQRQQGEDSHSDGGNWILRRW